ncbi:MAG TPA: hypothetical protein VM143_18105 [Acidimicrobiales bacterium]|nr:hypothetical protein [Acidimicrobiales bacterium]
MRDHPPSKRWYRVCSVLALLGFGAAIAWWPYSTSRVYDAVEAFERAAPYGGQVRLDGPGKHTFWIEGACLSCHDNEPEQYRDAATVRIEAPDGRPLRLRAAPSRVFNTARREGRALWVFDAPSTGDYRISLAFDTDGEEWDNTLPDDIAIGRGEGLPVGIVRPMAMLVGSGVTAALALAAITAWRRRRYFDSVT